MVQLAYKCFSRNPKDLRGQHIGVMLDSLFAIAANAMHRRGENANVIEDVDSLWLRGNVQLIRETNA